MFPAIYHAWQTRPPNPGSASARSSGRAPPIADTARRLFAERGFDAVTVAEIARAADVAQKTVFNYFPTKEDLFYSRLEAFEEELLAAIRERAAGRDASSPRSEASCSNSAACSATNGHDGDREATEQLHTITRVITESPALLARERQVLARYTEALAALLAEETGADPEPSSPGRRRGADRVHRSLIDYVRRRALAGAGAPRSAARSGARRSAPSPGSKAAWRTTRGADVSPTGGKRWITERFRPVASGVRGLATPAGVVDVPRLARAC